MLSDTNQRVTVHPFAPGLKTMRDIPIVTAALAYDCPTTMATYVLIFHQALFIPTMDNNLICPAQLRSNQLTVNDTPLIHIPSEQRCAEDHSILGPVDLHIPLSLDGTVSYFDCRTPTSDEVYSPSTRHIIVEMPANAEASLSIVFEVPGKNSGVL